MAALSMDPIPHKWRLDGWLKNQHKRSAPTRHKNTQEIFNTCAKFMEATCADRPPSHSAAHMHSVAELAKEIAIEEQREDLIVAVVVVAILHDYADGKYDLNGKLGQQLVAFLTSLFDYITASYIYNCIEWISYSKEAPLRAKHGHTLAEQWQTDLPEWSAELGEHWVKVRNIVSDADKLLASGEDGFQRTFGYKAEAYASKHNGAPIPEDLRREQMFEIYSNRLSRTHTHLMHTAAGRRRALLRFNVMEQVADRYFAGYEPYTQWKSNFIQSK